MAIASPFLGETTRLLIRPWLLPQDLAAAWAIYSDPEVMAFIRPPVLTPAELTAQLAERQQHYENRNNGTGRWALVEKATGQAIGTILLAELPDAQGAVTADYEVGWHLRRASWGQGYATEAARWAIHYGFQSLHLSQIYAVVRPDNQRSIRVTQRLGMQSHGLTTAYYGRELALFGITP